MTPRPSKMSCGWVHAFVCASAVCHNIAAAVQRARKLSVKTMPFLRIKVLKASLILTSCRCAVSDGPILALFKSQADGGDHNNDQHAKQDAADAVEVLL